MTKEKDWLDVIIEEHLEKTDEIPPLPRPFKTQDERSRWVDFIIQQKRYINKTKPEPTIYNWRFGDDDTTF